MRRRSAFGNTVLALLFTAFAGCGSGTHEVAPTVDWYRAHADEREAQVRTCSADPAVHNDSANCANALRASELESVGSLRNLPSMGLTPPKAVEPKETKSAE
jgi:hypothetical protein